MGRLPVTKAKSIEELLRANVAALRDLACEDEEYHYACGSELRRESAFRYRYAHDLLDELLAVYFENHWDEACAGQPTCEAAGDSVAVDASKDERPRDIYGGFGPLESLPVTEAGSLKDLLAANIAAFDEHVEKQTQLFIEHPQSWRREDIVRTRFAAEILRKLQPLA